MRTRTAVVVALLATAGLVVSITAAWPWLAPEPTVRSEPGPPARQVREPRPTVAAESSAPASRGDASLSAPQQSPAAPPVRVSLSSIDVQAPVRPVGVARDGQMELPPDPRLLGWYEYGPPPASGSGSVVLAGHLDSRRFGLGPLVRLRDIDPGDPVQVVSADGTSSTYRVTRIERFDQQALPPRIFARTGPERLRIVTCGGAYDPETGYEKNLVVTAAPVRP